VHLTSRKKKNVWPTGGGEQLHWAERKKKKPFRVISKLRKKGGGGRLALPEVDQSGECTAKGEKERGRQKDWKVIDLALWVWQGRTRARNSPRSQEGDSLQRSRSKKKGRSHFSGGRGRTGRSCSGCGKKKLCYAPLKGRTIPLKKKGETGAWKRRKKMI